MIELEKLIDDSKLKGVSARYIRKEYGEDVFNELIESGGYLKIKSMDCLHAGEFSGATVWALVMKGFERSIFS